MITFAFLLISSGRFCVFHPGDEMSGAWFLCMWKVNLWTRSALMMKVTMTGLRSHLSLVDLKNWRCKKANDANKTRFVFRQRRTNCVSLSIHSIDTLCLCSHHICTVSPAALQLHLDFTALSYPCCLSRADWSTPGLRFLQLGSFSSLTDSVLSLCARRQLSLLLERISSESLCRWQHQRDAAGAARPELHPEPGKHIELYLQLGSTLQPSAAPPPPLRPPPHPVQTWTWTKLQEPELTRVNRHRTASSSSAAIHTRSRYIKQTSSANTAGMKINKLRAGRRVCVRSQK